MAETCKFCKTVSDQVENIIRNTEEARQNGRQWVNEAYDTLTPAIVNRTHRTDIFRKEEYISGRTTIHFDEQIRFCPYCAADLRPIIAKLPTNPVKL